MSEFSKLMEDAILTILLQLFKIRVRDPNCGFFLDNPTFVIDLSQDRVASKNWLNLLTYIRKRSHFIFLDIHRPMIPFFYYRILYHFFEHFLAFNQLLLLLELLNLHLFFFYNLIKANSRIVFIEVLSLFLWCTGFDNCVFSLYVSYHAREIFFV
jgi:hypothetical protein